MDGSCTRAPRGPRAGLRPFEDALNLPASAEDVALLLRSSFSRNTMPRPHGHSHFHCILASLDIQKTGSTQLERIVHAAASAGRVHNMKLRGADACRLSVLSKETKRRGWSSCTRHGDSAHRARCARMNARRLQQTPPTEMYLLTMLRDPAQRLYSEWRHLNGWVSCHGGAWKHYAPASCDGTVLLPGQRWEGEPTPALAAYRGRLCAAYKNRSLAKPSFEEWLAVGSNCAHNRMVRQLAPMACARGALGSAAAYPGNEARMLAIAKEALRQHTLFGLTERYDESIDLLNRRIAAVFPIDHPLARLRLPSPAEVPLEGALARTHGARHHGPNASTTDNTTGAYAISAAAREIIATRSAQDVALYAYATRLFERLRDHPGLTLRPTMRPPRMYSPRPRPNHTSWTVPEGRAANADSGVRLVPSAELPHGPRPGPLRQTETKSRLSPRAPRRKQTTGMSYDVHES